MNDRTKKASLNIVFGIINRVIITIIDFAVRTYIIRYFGLDLLGLNALFVNIIQCLSLAELGMSQVLIFSFYKPLAENNNKKVNALVIFYKKIYSKIALAVLVMALCIIPFLDNMLDTSIPFGQVVIIFFLFVIETCSSYLFVYKIAVLLADQKSYIVSLYSGIIYLISAVLQLMAIVFFRNYILYMLIKILFGILNNFYISRVATKTYHLEEKTIELEKSERKNIYDIVKAGFVYKICAILLNSTDNIILSLVSGIRAVGLLSNYTNIITILSSYIVLIFQSFTAGIGNLVVVESREKKREVFEKILYMSHWFSIVFPLSILFLINDFIQLWVGEEYILGNDTVILRAFVMYLSMIMQPIFVFREALAMYCKTKYVMLTAAIINIITSLILGEYYGVNGVLLGTVIAMITTYVWYEPWLLYKDYFDMNSKRYFKLLLKNVVRFVWIGIIIQCLCKYIMVESWASWILKGTVVFGVINILLLVLDHKNIYFIFYKNTIIQAIRKRVRWSNGE